MAIQTPQASDPEAGNFGAISRMAGETGESQTNPMGPSGAPMGPGGDPQAALASITETIRGVEQTIDSVASQFPEAAQEARRARDAVRALMVRIVANPGGAEPAAPHGPLG